MFVQPVHNLHLSIPKCKAGICIKAHTPTPASPHFALQHVAIRTTLCRTNRSVYFTLQEPSNMFNSVYFYLLVLAAWVYANETVIDPESAQRMFIVTNTVAYMSTTTIPTTVVRTCYVTNSSVPACRRRRSIEEKAILISFDDVDLDDVDINLSPSKAIAVESTATALLEPLVAEPAAETVVHSSVDGVEAEVIDHSSSIEQRKPIFFFIRQNTYTTLTMTSYSTVTSGSKPFTIDNCLPLGIAYPAC